MDIPNSELMRALEGVLLRLLRSAFAGVEPTTAHRCERNSPVTCHLFRLDDALGFKLLMRPLSARRG